jgi:transcriptional regulator with XRE-family HTH domain
MRDLASHSTVEEQIGLRIRALRAVRAVTLEQLAAEVKLTKGQLSKIENGKVSSPVSTLTRIAAALGVSPGQFFQAESGQPRAVLVPKNARKTIVGRGSKLGHSYESLAFGLPFEKDFEPYLMRIDEKQIDPDQNIFKHPGHELLFMIKGEMDYRHADKVYHLKAGDSLFFDGNVEHGPIRVYNPPVDFVCVISNPKA